MFLNLTEALNIQGAIFKGTGNNFDVYEIESWAAATSFVIDSDNSGAGTFFFQDRNTFLSNCGPAERYEAFYFTRHDTNRCVSAVIVRFGNSSQESMVTVEDSTGNHSLDIGINGSYESIDSHSSKITADTYVPLYLIDSLRFYFKGVRIDNNKGFAYYPSEKKLYGVLAILTPETNIQINLAENEINELADNAFQFGVTADTIDSDNDGFDLPDDSNEVIEEPHQPAIHPEDYLLYKIEKDHVVIKGLKKDVDDIVIPSEIQGKPVTEIAPYAFAYCDANSINNDENSTNLTKLGKCCFGYNDKTAGTIYVKMNGRDLHLGLIVPRSTHLEIECVY